MSHLALHMIRLPEGMAYLQEWRRLLSALALSVERGGSNCSNEDILVAERSIAIVHALECNDVVFDKNLFYIPDPLDPDTGSLPLDDEEAYKKWRDNFDPDQSLFPDIFVFALSTIARKEPRWYRVRRLVEIGYLVMSP